MTPLQLTALLPYILLAAASIVVILLIAFKASHTTIQVVGFLLMCGVAVSLFKVKGLLPVSILPLFEIDGFALLFTGLIIFCVLVVGLFSFIYFEEREENPKEYYILLFLSTLGAATLTISRHFISLFIGLEILSVSLYALIAYLRTRNNAVEAGIKYLVLAALSSAFLLFGMALIYMDTGTMEFTAIAQKLNSSSALFTMGIGLMVVAIGFKLALVPFHFWAADVYQGARHPLLLLLQRSPRLVSLQYYFVSHKLLICKTIIGSLRFCCYCYHFNDYRQYPCFTAEEYQKTPRLFFNCSFWIFAGCFFAW
jgi:NADH-quinone oxidoreductase subunit N